VRAISYIIKLFRLSCLFFESSLNSFDNLNFFCLEFLQSMHLCNIIFILFFFALDYLFTVNKKIILIKKIDICSYMC